MGAGSWGRLPDADADADADAGAVNSTTLPPPYHPTTLPTAPLPSSKGYRSQDACAGRRGCCKGALSSPTAQKRPQLERRDMPASGRDGPLAAALGLSGRVDAAPALPNPAPARPDLAR